jgi:hypothetical protein
MEEHRENASTDRTIDVSTDDARQGVTGHNVRYMLLFGTLAVIIGFAVVALLFHYGFAAGIFGS